MSDSGSDANQENREGVSAKELSAVLSKDSRAVRELQSRLSNLGGSRSTVGRQLRDIGSELRVLVPKISGLKSARDKETAAVKELKAKREQANNEARLLGPEVRKALDAKEAAVSSLSKSKGNAGRKSASQLYSEMEDLEMKIITEAMPFSKEQEIMKVIKEKRKQLEAVKAFSDAMKSHRELFSKFSELRRQSYAFHAELQKHAAESQRFHEEMIKLIPRIKELRQRRKSLVGQFGSVKQEYTTAETSLQEKLHEISDVKEKLDTIAAARKKAEVEQKESFLTQKLKSGKKLTARDLIMLHGK
ncbi:hypothetical protein HYV83_04575 [Candidatus Woesearchaeota archaeon]|nr:hypothetical protein [Candidatus Woesearchaeota archaeon]